MSQFGHTHSAEVESGHGPTLKHLLQQTKNHKLKGSVCIADDTHIHACNLKSKTEKELKQTTNTAKEISTEHLLSEVTLEWTDWWCLEKTKYVYLGKWFPNFICIRISWRAVKTQMASPLPSEVLIQVVWGRTLHVWQGCR